MKVQMKHKSKDQPGKAPRKACPEDRSFYKRMVKQRTHRGRQLAGFKTIWR
jgi:hypothetical protein